MDTEKLLEAEAVSGEGSTTDPSNGAEWNKLYLSAKGRTPGAKKNYVCIQIEGDLKSRNPDLDFGSGAYIQYTGETSEKEMRILVAHIRKIDLTDLENLRVTDMDISSGEFLPGTVFTPSDADEIIMALKRNREIDARNVTFKKVPATGFKAAEEVTTQDVLLRYVKAQAGVNGSRIFKDQSAINFTLAVCDAQDDKPLSGNDTLDIIIAGAKSTDVRDSKVFSGRMPNSLNDLVADNIIKKTRVLNPTSILDSLAFNASLYSMEEEDVDDMFEIFREVKGFDLSKMNLEGLKVKSSLILAKNVIFVTKGDALKTYLEAEEHKAELPLEDIPFNWKESPAPIETPLRAIGEIKKLYAELQSRESTKEEKGSRSYHYYIQHIIDEEVEVHELKGVLEDGDGDLSSEKLSIEANEQIKIVYTSEESSDKKTASSKITSKTSLEGFEGIGTYSDGIITFTKDWKGIISVDIVDDRVAQIKLGGVKVVKEPEVKSTPTREEPKEEPKAETKIDWNAFMDLDAEARETYINSLPEETQKEIRSKINKVFSHK